MRNVVSRDVCNVEVVAVLVDALLTASGHVCWTQRAAVDDYFDLLLIDNLQSEVSNVSF